MSLRARVKLRRPGFELDVELDAADGEVLAVLGPNGAGKTTLLRALAGLDPIAAGEVTVDGRILDAPERNVFVEPEARSVGVVFQDYLLFPHLSALANVTFGLEARRLAEPEQRAREWLTRVGVAELADRRPGTLSGGQAQRVALARALAVAPRLLLLDEPMAALDAGTRASVRRELKQHLATFEGTAVLVTHDPVDAAALATRVAVLEDGRVTQSGSVGEITACPRSRYVADLVGVNLWRGHGVDGAVDLGPIKVAASGVPEGEAFVAVHPRSVALYRERPQGSPRNVWQGRVTAIDATPAGVRVSVDAGVTVVAEITTAALADLRLTGGESVWVSFKASEATAYEA